MKDKMIYFIFFLVAFSVDVFAIETKLTVQQSLTAPQKKIIFARKFLTAYKYPAMITGQIEFLSSPYKNVPKINSAKFKSQLLDIAIDMTVNDLVANYSEDQLAKIVEFVYSEDGKLFLDFVDKFFQGPHSSALIALNSTLINQAKNKNVAVVGPDLTPKNRFPAAEAATNIEAPKILANKSAAARKILMAYRYPQLVVLVMNDILKPYSRAPAMNTPETRNKLLNAGFDGAVADLVKTHSEAELNKLAAVFTSADGKSLVNFIDKFFQTAQPKAISVLKTSIQQQAHGT